MSINPYSSPTATPTQANPRSKVQLPAIFLLVVSLLGMTFMTIGGGFWGVRFAAGDLTRKEELLAVQIMGFASTNFLVCAIVLAGAISMLRMKPRWLALVGAVAALIPVCGPCYVLAIPFGIWAILVLRKPEVIDAFQAAEMRRSG